MHRGRKSGFDKLGDVVSYVSKSDCFVQVEGNTDLARNLLFEKILSISGGPGLEVVLGM
jgi:hypothetical protein